MKTRKIKPFLNWKAITLLMCSMFSFAASVGLAIHSMSTRDITFSILGSVALGAGLLMGLLGALWWNTTADRS